MTQNQGPTTFPSEDLLNRVCWGEDGLVAAVAQDFKSGRVLTVAWMNREALRESVGRGEAVYWSRSRKRLWRKGEESGQLQSLIELRVDCDGDAVLLLVDQHGPACHTGARSCFDTHAVPVVGT